MSAENFYLPYGNMSRLAKKPIPIPAGTEMREESGMIILKGTKGELKIPLRGVQVAIEPQQVTVKIDENKASSNVGTLWSLIKNGIEGVTNGFTKVLEIEGVGYKAVLEGGNLSLSLGFAHPVKVISPEGIVITVEKNTITISGIHKERVGQVAAYIRAQKKPEPYKGKGIHYKGEVIRRKVGKKAGAAAA